MERPGIPAGRAERVGMLLEAFNVGIAGPRFEFAGASHTYSPDPANPGIALSPNFLEKACMDADFLHGILTEVGQEIEDFVNSHGTEIGVGIAAVAIVAGIATLVILLAIFAIFVAIFAALINALPRTPHLGDALDELQDVLLNRADPDERKVGAAIWQMIAFKLFSDQQGPLDFDAISYAVMDRHDYFDRSCNVNVDSIEVFFDAADPMLVAYVDALIAFETAQETMGRAFVGYASLRFTSSTRALIGEERFDRTCVIEIAGLKDVAGVTPLMDYAVMLALDPNFNAILHWGQRNDATRADIQRLFGDTFADRTGRLHRWRTALGRLTDNGRLGRFSNAFTRQTGLEVVTPRIGNLTVPPDVVSGHAPHITWDCSNNPPGTTVTLQVSAPGNTTNLPGLPLTGQHDVVIGGAGTAVVVLVASLSLGGENRDDVRTAVVAVNP